MHQNGRRVPLNLQPTFKEEINRLQRDGPIEKLSN